MIPRHKKELTTRRTRTERERHRQQRFVHALYISIRKQERMAEDHRRQGRCSLIASAD